MTNSFYVGAKQGLLVGSINWLRDKFRLSIVDRDLYEPDLEQHRYLTDLVGVIATSSPLQGKVSVDGCVKADPAIFEAVPEVSVSRQGLVLHQDTGIARESYLIAYLDEVRGLPLILDGGSVSVAWPDQIFRL